MQILEGMEGQIISHLVNHCILAVLIKIRSGAQWMLGLLCLACSSVSLRDAEPACLALLEPDAGVTGPQLYSQWHSAVVCCKQQAQKGRISQLSLSLV